MQKIDEEAALLGRDGRGEFAAEPRGGKTAVPEGLQRNDDRRAERLVHGCFLGHVRISPLKVIIPDDLIGRAADFNPRFPDGIHFLERKPAEIGRAQNGDLRPGFHFIHGEKPSIGCVPDVLFLASVPVKPAILAAGYGNDGRLRKRGGIAQLGGDMMYGGRILTRKVQGFGFLPSRNCISINRICMLLNIQYRNKHADQADK